MKLLALDASTFATALHGTTIDLVDGAGQDNSVAIAAIFISAGYTAAAIGWEASMDGTTWFPVIDTAGAAVSLVCTGTTAEAMAVPPTTLCGFPYLRPVSATTIVTGTITPIVRHV